MNNSVMPKELRRWEVTRLKGKWRFILLTGVLSWGLPMFVVMTFVVNQQPSGSSPSLSMILMSATIWALGGALFGWAMWKVSERKYHRFLAAQKGE
jgi:hypothetical protein